MGAVSVVTWLVQFCLFGFQRPINKGERGRGGVYGSSSFVCPVF